MDSRCSCHPAPTPPSLPRYASVTLLAGRWPLSSPRGGGSSAVRREPTTPVRLASPLATLVPPGRRALRAAYGEDERRETESSEPRIRESAGTDRKGADYIGWPIRNPRETRERVMLTQGRVLTETVDNLTKNSASLVPIFVSSFRSLRVGSHLLPFGHSVRPSTPFRNP